jgi:hypothetical protein
MSEIKMNTVKFSVIGILGLIFVLLIWIKKTDYFIKKDYLAFKESEFKNVVLDKIDEHPIKSNKIYLKSGRELVVPRKIFDQLAVGDSVVKMFNSDSVYFYSEQELIIYDYNKFNRLKFLESKE